MKKENNRANLKDIKEGAVFSIKSAKKDISFGKEHCPLVFQIWVMLSWVMAILLIFSPYRGFLKFFESPSSIAVFIVTKCLGIIGLLFLFRGLALGSGEGYPKKFEGKKPRKKLMKRAGFSIAIGLCLLVTAILWGMYEVDPNFTSKSPSKIAESAA